MTTYAAATRVRADGGGRLQAECLSCQAEMVLAPGADVAGALAALDEAHPTGPHAGRRPVTPVGWQVTSSSRGRERDAPARRTWWT